MDTADIFSKAGDVDRPELGQGSLLLSTLVCALK